MSAPAGDSLDASASVPGINLTVQMSGGLELLFDKVKLHKIHLTHQNSQPPATLTAPPSSSLAVQSRTEPAVPLTIRSLIAHLVHHKLRDRPELFIMDESVRPGILVLVNDCDWELLDGLDARLSDGDTVTFISTLHGG